MSECERGDAGSTTLLGWAKEEEEKGNDMRIVDEQ